VEEYVEKSDAVAVAPEVYSVVFENDRVRVLDVTGVPGTISPMHGHPDSVMHALSNATIVVTTDQGESDELQIPAGATFWTPATTHSVENVGAETVRFIRVELK
jgi:quercetin dioxygenase-like cupin family protein